MKYAFCQLCRALIKQVLCGRACLCAFGGSGPNHGCQRKRTLNRLFQISGSPAPLHFPLCLSLPDSFFLSNPREPPPLPCPSDCGVVAGSLSVGHSCMCILTQVVSPSPPKANTSVCLPSHPIFINNQVSIGVILKAKETDGCCCLQVQLNHKPISHDTLNKVERAREGPGNGYLRGICNKHVVRSFITAP